MISLCRRSDGTLWCLDGQHRVLAARRHGIPSIPAIIFQMTSDAEEADAFLGLNTLSKPLTGVEKHLARTTRLDPAAALVDQLITSANRVASANSTANSVRCIAAMTKLATSSPETLKKLWPAIASISEGGPLHERFLVGMVWLEDHLAEDSLLEPRWIKRLTAAGAEGCIAAINRSVAFHVKGGERVYAEGLLQLLNRGLREDRHLKIRGAS